MIGCDCAVCTSPDPHDKRSRPSAYVEYEGFGVLIDTTPELRLQCLANDIRRVDAVLYTHSHADHVVGLDDLRRFNWLQKSDLPCYASAETLDQLAEMFYYVWDHDPDYPSAKPRLTAVEIDGPFVLGPRNVEPLDLLHGEMPVLGFRFGPFAYCTDCSHIPEQTLVFLDGVEVLVLDALRRRPHPTHFTLDQAVEMARVIGAKQTFFTHIAHELGHAETNAELPDGMALGYDGQRIELTW